MRNLHHAMRENRKSQSVGSAPLGIEPTVLSYYNLIFSKVPSHTANSRHCFQRLLHLIREQQRQEQAIHPWLGHGGNASIFTADL